MIETLDRMLKKALLITTACIPLIIVLESKKKNEARNQYEKNPIVVTGTIKDAYTIKRPTPFFESNRNNYFITLVAKDTFHFKTNKQLYDSLKQHIGNEMSIQLTYNNTTSKKPRLDSKNIIK